jgi:flagellin
LNTQLNATEVQLSTGQAVNSPSDNPTLWAAATAAQSGAMMWGDVANQIGGTSTSVLATATTALSTVLQTLGSMKTLVENVQSGSTTSSAALASLQQYGQTLTSTVGGAASSNGENLLDGSTSSVEFVDGYTPTGGVQSVSFTTSALTGSGGYLTAAQASDQASSTDLTALTSSDLTTDVDATLANIEQAITNVTNYSTSVGDVSSSETTAQDFATSMQTNFQNASDDLIGADMSAVSTREAALQTQIQMATQALSIANQSSALVLKLFQ